MRPDRRMRPPDARPQRKWVFSLLCCLMVIAMLLMLPSDERAAHDYSDSEETVSGDAAYEQEVEAAEGADLPNEIKNGMCLPGFTFVGRAETCNPLGFLNQDKPMQPGDNLAQGLHACATMCHHELNFIYFTLRPVTHSCRIFSSCSLHLSDTPDAITCRMQELRTKARHHEDETSLLGESAIMLGIMVVLFMIIIFCGKGCQGSPRRDRREDEYGLTGGSPWRRDAPNHGGRLAVSTAEGSAPNDLPGIKSSSPIRFNPLARGGALSRRRANEALAESKVPLQMEVEDAEGSPRRLGRSNSSFEALHSTLAAESGKGGAVAEEVATAEAEVVAEVVESSTRELGGHPEQEGTEGAAADDSDDTTSGDSEGAEV